jgi:predicted nuclease with TOPRIM domain
MEWILASLAILTAAMICAVLLLASRQRAAEARQRELLLHLEELQSTVSEQQRQLESLQSTKAGVQANRDRNRAPDPLALIEQLNDVAALHDQLSLENTANQVSELPAGIAADLFAADHKLLAISRLLKQGNSLSEVAARLNLPLGEVELLANTRS